MVRCRRRWHDGLPAALFALLGAAALTACSGPSFSPRRSILLTSSELMEGIPDAQSGNARTRYAERTPSLGVYFVELGGSVPLERIGGTLRLVVLSGRLRLRAGGAERILGAGGYAAVPAGMPYRLLREGPERLRYAVFLSPDSPGRAALEGPFFLRHLERSS